MSQWFYNLPSMPDVETVDAAATFLDASRVAGYRGCDGLRACVEIDGAVAEMLERAAEQVQVRAGMLEAIAETMKVT